MPDIFQPLALNNTITLPNRLALAPMTTQQSNADGTISGDEANWLQRASTDGYGMVISCAAAISGTSIAFYNQLNLGSDAGLEALMDTAQKMQKSINIIQLCHAGARAVTELTGVPATAPSAFNIPDIPNFKAPLPLSEAQIETIVNDFAKAAGRAKKAGFHGIELHGANGYLFTQFFSTMTNTRTDAWGGNVQGRAKFAIDVVKACRKEAGEDFIIGFRMSFENMGPQTGLDIDENIAIINLLAEAGINYCHFSHLAYNANTQKYPEQKLITYLRARLNPSLPLIAVGGVTTRTHAEDALLLGADAVAVGRAAIGNIGLPETFRANKQLQHQTPYTAAHLIETGISEAFRGYLLNAPPLRSLNIVQQ